MSIDLKIMIRPNGDQCDFEVSGWPTNAPPARFPRVKPVVNPTDMETLRRGSALPLDVDRIAANLNLWALGADFGALMQTIVNAAPEPLRLIFDIGDPQRFPEFNDLPIEMLALPAPSLPLALHQKVESIVHLLDKVGGPSPIIHDWPLRVLIVRSNPRSLGGAVPPALPFRDEILTNPFVEVDVLTRESGPGVRGLPTPQEFIRQLRSANYDILIYLGHGDLLPTHEGVPPVGVLKLENADGSGSDDLMDARRLALALHESPIPVVLLLGCLTAAQLPPQVRQTIDPEISKWMRGSQGVAQALINSAPGVQLAVGMRFQIDSADATTFLKAFFHSLLQRQPGHVEAAIRAGRRELDLLGIQRYAWSAPMIFRTLGTEPLLSFMAARPPRCPTMEQHDAFRAPFWRMLALSSLSQRDPDQINLINDALGGFARDFGRMLERGMARLVPERTELLPGETGDLHVRLIGDLNVSEIEGRLALNGQDAELLAITPTLELRNQDFNVFAQVDAANQMSFIIRSKDSQSRSLSSGTPLFKARLRVGLTAGVVYPIGVEGLKTQPSRRICPGNDAIIVPRA